MSNHYLTVTQVIAVCLALGGCATKPTTLYEWDRYQSNIYAYLRPDKVTPDMQMLQMEEDLAKIKANGAAVPPGYYAQLGLLYGEQGKLDQFVTHMQMEKKQFPESETFMDFLLRKFKK